MTGPEVLDVARDSIVTLVFVPKILAIFVAMLLALPFMADALQGHMARLAARIIGG